MRGWALWALPKRARRYVLAVDLLALLALGYAVSTAPLRVSDAGTFAAFLLCGCISVEGSRRLGSPESRRDRAYKDLLAAWTLPVALLLPPVYATVIYVPIIALAQVRVTSLAPVKRIFNLAVMMLAGFLAATTQSVLTDYSGPLDTAALVGSPYAVAVTMLAAGIFATVSAGLVAEALRRISPGATRRQALGTRDDFVIDAADICLGLLVAVIWTAAPVFVAVALLPVLLLQRTLLHGELLQASRTDAKTGLANPAHWREVAEREIARALRGGTPLAVLLVDIDYFKRVNDTAGHLAGDSVLAAVAEALRETVRPRDLVGRFGGEEFVVLLPEVAPEVAERTAERVRERVARLRCPVGERRAAVSVTVSIGVATLSPETADLTSLLNASDAALYRAKSGGRDRVVKAASDSGTPTAVRRCGAVAPLSD